MMKGTISEDSKKSLTVKIDNEEVSLETKRNKETGESVITGGGVALKI